MKSILFILLQFVLIACGSYNINLCIESSYSEIEIRKLVPIKIDSLYEHMQGQQRKRQILEGSCSQDSLLMFKVQNENNWIDWFYFDSNLNLVEIIHDFPEVH